LALKSERREVYDFSPSTDGAALFSEAVVRLRFGALELTATCASTLIDFP